MSHAYEYAEDGKLDDVARRMATFIYDPMA